MGSELPLILEAPRTGRIYAVPVEACRVIVTGSQPDGGKLERFVDLRNGETVFLSRDDVVGYVVADDQLHATLRAHGVTGLRRVDAADGRTPPLAGNFVDPSWVAINLGGRCGSRCSFCFTESIRHEPDLSSSLVLEILDMSAALETVRTVVFTGGEPTLRRDLIDLIRAARRRGLTDVALQTNGHRLANASYAAALTDAGLTRVLLSLHGATAETHANVTGVGASFRLAKRALEVLSQQSVITIVNYVVCRQNLHETEQFVRLVDEVASAVPIRFSYPIVEGAAFTNASSLLPTLPEFVAAVRAARSARQTDGEIAVHNVPACVSDEIGLAPTYLVSQRRSLLNASPFYREPHERGEVLAKVSACDSCAHTDDCGGVQVPYLVRFADAHRHVRPRRPGVRVG